MTLGTCRRCGADFEGLILKDGDDLCAECQWLEKLEKYEEGQR